MQPKRLIDAAVADIRAAESRLAGIVADLQRTGVWTGADADRFQREWNDLVRGRLLSAASQLEGTRYTPAE